MNAIPYRIFQSPNFSLRESSKKKLDTASSRGHHGCLTSALTARFDLVVTRFAVGDQEIDADTVAIVRDLWPWKVPQAKTAPRASI